MHFSVVDRIVAREPGAWVRAEKRLAGDEAFLADHFPGAPVMPGALILEAMVHSGDWLLHKDRGDPLGSYWLSKVRGVRFAQFVKPGETMTVLANLVRAEGAEVEMLCRAEVEGRPVVSGRLTLSRRRQLDSGNGEADRATGGDAQTTTAEAGDFHWLWLDRFSEFHTRHSVRASKRVPGGCEGYVLGRVSPERLTSALVLEGLAQTGGLLAFDSIRFDRAPIMAKVVEAEFFFEPPPGETLTYVASLEAMTDEAASVRAASCAGDRLHAQVRLLFALFRGDRDARAAIDPAVFYTMMVDTGAFDAIGASRPVRRVQPAASTADHGVQAGAGRS